jgi:uncharacterized protein RhaS with RHS repeats
MSDGTGATTYSHNSRGELKSVSGPGGSYSYSYDPSGNVTSRSYPDGAVIGYTYDRTTGSSR